MAGYAVFSAIRIPEVKTVEFASPKLNKEISLVHLSDLHISRSTSADRIRAIVDKVNALKPDVIVITGDLVDDNPAAIRDKMQILADLKSPEGVYVSIGNHELYAGLLNWLKEFKRLGFKVLLNNGELLKNKRVFIAGVADAGSFAFKPELSLNLSPSAPAGQGRPYRIIRNMPIIWTKLRLICSSPGIRTAGRFSRFIFWPGAPINIWPALIASKTPICMFRAEPVTGGRRCACLPRRKLP